MVQMNALIYACWANLVLIYLKAISAANTTVLHTDPEAIYGSDSPWVRRLDICGAGFSWSNISGGWVKLDFEGTAIQVHFTRAFEGSSAQVLLDDVIQSAYEGINMKELGVNWENCRTWVYEKSGLEWGRHNVTVVNVGTGYTVVNKFVYTKPDSPTPLPSSQSSPSSTSCPRTSGSDGPDGPMIGGIVGGIVGGLVFGALGCYLILQKRCWGARTFDDTTEQRIAAALSSENGVINAK